MVIITPVFYDLMFDNTVATIIGSACAIGIAVYSDPFFDKWTR